MTQSPRYERFFTVVFKGDIRERGGNPFHVDTPFGRPHAITMGDALAELEELADDGETEAGK